MSSHYSISFFFQPFAFESPATNLYTMGPKNVLYASSLVMYTICAIFLWLRSGHLYYQFLTIISTILLISYLAFLGFINRPRVLDSRYRLNHILSRCFSIDTLRFEYLTGNIINQIRDFFDDVIITNLVANMTELDEERR